MVYHFAGNVLIVLGCLFVLAALARFCADLYQQMRPPERKKGFAADAIGKYADLITALSKLPPWALSAVIGIVLVVVGGWIVQDRPITP
jgi:hypothetical protein